MSTDLIISNETVEAVQDMKLGDVYALATQAQAFNQLSNVELVVAMKHINNLRTQNKDGGFSKGVSNKVVCARETVNHMAVHEALVVLGWLDLKCVTLKGWDETHNYPDGSRVNVAFPDHRPVFDMFNGSLYWNETHTEYTRVWEIVLDVKTPNYGVVRDTTYNKGLKDTEGCMSGATRAMLKASGKSVV